MGDRVLLLLPTTSYKAEDFLAAAERLGIGVVVGTDRRQALEGQAPGHSLALPFDDPARSVARIRESVASRSLRAVIGVDDETTVLAASAAAALGLPHNPVEAVRDTRDKHRMRCKLSGAGLRGPRFERVALDVPAGEAAARTSYPCVLKPLFLSAGRGVLRADDPASFVEAFHRVAAILREPDVVRRGGDDRHLLVEEYLPGAEVALEGLLTGGCLRALALFDKPDPLTGPVFEETLYITPTQHAAALQTAVLEETERACRALGLVEGPVHAELRLYQNRPWLIEVAPRTIGGLCSRALRFGTGATLEELVLAHALGRGTLDLAREGRASGVMMIPVPGAGTLRGVRGLDAARAEPHVEEVTISRHQGAELVPLPEGHRYLGFIFARATTPGAVERALRRAHARLSFDIDGTRR